MPGWPSPAERRALDAFPEQIGPEDLDEHFKLSPADMRFALKHRGDSRLGVAVQLCTLRWLGFVPEELTEIPQPALLELCEQLEVNAADSTRTAPAGRRAASSSRRRARTSAAGRGMCPRPRRSRRGSLSARWSTSARKRWSRSRPSSCTAGGSPSIDQLVRLIGAAHKRAHQATFDALADQFTDRATRARLDRLLERRADGTTWIEWLRKPAPDASPRYILGQLEKLNLSARARR
jgi:Domain of unknown function (DUF4158)